MSSSECAGSKHARFSTIAEHTVSVSNSVGLRIYSNTRPWNWKIARLQKGLIFVYKQVETIGEGAGFGVPVIACPNETYFSGSSNVYLLQECESSIVRKEFRMDCVARNSLKNVKLENRHARSILKRFSTLYQRYEQSRFPILTLKNLLVRMGVKTDFVKVPSLGRAIVTYNIHRDHIVVRVDFSNLKKKSLWKIFVLNEQGTRFFRRYCDSCGNRLVDQHVGAWDEIEADWANITNSKGDTGFRLYKTLNSIFRVGREFQNNCLDWIGLDYEVNSKDDFFEYTIEILGA
jgi:hypothetical protein